MASYHLSIKAGSKSKGQSAAAKSDYILREGKYAKGKGADEVVFSESGHMPAWAAGQPRDYWAAADEHERKNGCVFKEIVTALPRTFTSEQRIAAMRAQTEKVTVFVDRDTGETVRLPYTFALHAGLDEEGNEHNPHGHLMVSERGLDGHDRDAATWFRRPEAGGVRKTRMLMGKAWLGHLREWSANYHNVRLPPEERVDHRSYAERGLLRLPQIHLGVKSYHAMQNGRTTERTERYRHIRTLNRDLVEWATRGESTVPWHEVDRSREILYAMAEADSVELPDGAGVWPAWADLVEQHRRTVKYVKDVWTLQWLRYKELYMPLREVNLETVFKAARQGKDAEWSREPDDVLLALSEQPDGYAKLQVANTKVQAVVGNVLSYRRVQRRIEGLAADIVGQRLEGRYVAEGREPPNARFIAHQVARMDSAALQVGLDAAMKSDAPLRTLKAIHDCLGQTQQNCARYLTQFAKSLAPLRSVAPIASDIDLIGGLRQGLLAEQDALTGPERRDLLRHLSYYTHLEYEEAQDREPDDRLPTPPEAEARPYKPLKAPRDETRRKGGLREY